AELDMCQQLGKERVQVFELAWSSVVVKHVEVDADVRFAALRDQRQRGVQAGAERVPSAKFERQAHAKAGGPLGGLSERDDGALERRDIHRLSEVRRHQ